MFEFIRTHQRLMQLALLLIIFPSFAFVGIQGYSHFGEGENMIAKVAGQPITKQEWDAAQREQMDRFRQMFGAQFDAKMFDTPEAKQRILDNLIAQRALAAEVTRDHLSVSDQSLQQAILGIQGLTNAEGKFDAERYQNLLAAQGMSPTQYEARLRQDMALQQLNGAIQSSGFAPKAVAAHLSDLNDQEREVQELSFKSADYVSQVKITDDMLKAYYNKNGSQFEIPEQAKAEYVVLSMDGVAAQIAVSDADIKSYYEQNGKRYTVDEQRRASHILIKVDKNASDSEKAAAKAKAEKLLAQVRKNPAEFGKLAKENSDDSGSAEHNGDLDFFSKGMMVKPFEEAAYRLKPGEISDLVQSEFGYHIIQLTAVKPAAAKTLDDVKSEIATEIKRQKATKEYSAQAEIFTNTVYEQADSLKPVADKLKLKIETADHLGRQPNPAMAPNVPVNNPKFLKALFSDEAIKNKHNTEAIEVAPNTLVAGRAVEYKPATKRPFQEVQAVVRANLTRTEAADLARKAGEAKLAALRVKDEATGFGEAKTVSRAKNQGFNPAALSPVMKADVTKVPAFVGVELPGQGYNVYRIGKVAQPATQDAARRQAEQQQVVNALAQQEMAAYIDVLKQKAKVKILKSVATLAPGDGRDGAGPERE